MIKKLCIGAILAIMLFLSVTNAQASVLTPDIGFDPVTQNVMLGDPALVNLFISGLGDYSAPSLSTFDLNVSFDPAILRISGVTFGDPVLGDQLDIWGFGSIYSFDDSIPGVVNLFELSLDNPLDLENMQAGSFTLASLTFDTLALGTSPLNLGINALGDAYGNPIAVDILSGSVNVNLVPEPGTLLLVASGLAGIGYLRKKRFF